MTTRPPQHRAMRARPLSLRKAPARAVPWRRPLSALGIAVGVLFGAWPATGCDSPSDPSQVCVPGATTSCACGAGALGYQSCEPSGAAYAACVCTGVSPDALADVGNPKDVASPPDSGATSDTAVDPPDAAGCPSGTAPTWNGNCEPASDIGGAGVFLYFPVANSSLNCTTYSNHPQNGCDLSVGYGTPVGAPVDGVVTAAIKDECDDNTSPLPAGGYSPFKACRNGAGNYVVIRTSDGVDVWLEHLQKGSLLVSMGATVCAGQEIAKSGASGSVASVAGGTTGAHLHVAVKKAGTWLYAQTYWLDKANFKLGTPCGGVCTQPLSQPCGNCGTQTRTCDTATGTPTAWSICSGQGVCSPNAVEPCGNSGTRLCTSGCTWGQCNGEKIDCIGPPTEGCEKCGTRARTCDTQTGLWGAWGACSGQGVCESPETLGCGTDGTKACTASCQWGPCENESIPCVGPSTEPCEQCDTRTRQCNTATGEWSAWGPCSGGGVCEPDTTQSCGTCGSATCAANCSWGSCKQPECCNAQDCSCGSNQTASCSGGSCSCEAKPMSVVSSPGLNSWTAEPGSGTLDCSCSASDSDCHAIYIGRVTSIKGNLATLEVQKVGGGALSATVKYWVAVQEKTYPSCTDNTKFATRVDGSWPMSSPTLQIKDVPIWPTDGDLEAAACGATKHLHVMSGGKGLTDQKVWFQYQAIKFTKTCE
jgi:murein DD-endopeptidase MepM/ murein hydrolase activator NlpD